MTRDPDLRAALQALEQLIGRAHKEACRVSASGGRWRMSIPPQPDDPDVVICDALRDAEDRIAVLLREPAGDAGAAARASDLPVFPRWDKDRDNPLPASGGRPEVDIQKLLARADDAVRRFDSPWASLVEELATALRTRGGAPRLP